MILEPAEQPMPMPTAPVPIPTAGPVIPPAEATTPSELPDVSLWRHMQTETGRLIQSGEATVSYYGDFTFPDDIYHHPYVMVQWENQFAFIDFDYGVWYLDFWLADIDGDGLDEIIVHKTISGEGYCESIIYKMVDDAPVTLYHSNVHNVFDSGFSLSLEDSWMATVENRLTGFAISFPNNGQFEQGISYGCEPFSIFEPIYIHDDRVPMLLAQQNMIVHDNDFYPITIGYAYTLLRWDDLSKTLIVVKAGFFPKETWNNNDDFIAYAAKMSRYQDTWYIE